MLIEEFIETDLSKQPILYQAIKFCKKNNATLIVAKLDRLSLERGTIFFIKKNL